MIDRRRFCAGVVACAGGALLASCGGVPIVAGKLRNEEVLVPLSALPAPGATGILVRAPGQVQLFALSVLEDGKILALSALCTHLGCEIRPAPTGWTCPCHGSTFDDRGRATRGPAMARLPEYPTRSIDNEELLAIGVTPSRTP